MQSIRFAATRQRFVERHANRATRGLQDGSQGRYGLGRARAAPVLDRQPGLRYRSKRRTWTTTSHMAFAVCDRVDGTSMHCRGDACSAKRAALLRFRRGRLVVDRSSREAPSASAPERRKGRSRGTLRVRIDGHGRRGEEAKRRRSAACSDSAPTWDSKH